MQPDELTHFEKLLDEFEEDALAAAGDNSFPSESKVVQYNLARRDVLAFVEGIVLNNIKDLDAAVESSSNEDRLRKERDQLHEYLYDVVMSMSSQKLSDVSGIINLDYCQAILDNASEFVK